MDEEQTPEQVRAASHAAATALAARQEGILARRQLYGLGVTRSQVKAKLRSGVWSRRGRQTVSTTTGLLSPTAQWWVAVLETGPHAALDGVSGLQAAGVTGLSDSVIHVIVPKSSQPLKPRGVVVHESRRFREPEVLKDGVRRTAPAVAAVHAALWAATDRQAALFLVMAVQQQVTDAVALREALDAVRRHKRRRTLALVIADVADGAHSLNELDVLRAVRARGLPEPTRQRVVSLPTGRVYLDVAWDRYGIGLEVDGAQHDQVGARLDDVLRDLGVAGTGRAVVRLPVLAWRLDRERILTGLEAMLRARGWDPDSQARAA